MSVKGRFVSGFYSSEEHQTPMLYLSIRTEEDKKIFLDPIASPIRPYFYFEKNYQDELNEKLQMYGLQRNEFDFVDCPTYKFAFSDKKVVRCDMWQPFLVGEVRKKIEPKSDIKFYEADIPFMRRILIDKKIKAGIEVTPSGEMKPYDGKLPNLRYLFIDIEVDDSNGFPETAGDYAILCIGTTNDKGVTKYFTWSWGKNTEEEMLEEFFDYASNYDVLVCWNKDFESSHIPARTRALDFYLEWRIFLWVDLADFFRMYFQETYFEKLPYAYGRILKKFDSKIRKSGLLKHETIERLPNYYKAWKSEPKRLEEVNLSHSYALFIMEYAMEVIKLYAEVSDECGITLDYANFNSHIVDTYALRLIAESKQKWVIPSTKRYDDKKKGFRGAVVFPSIRGIHQFVYLFDFTSLYNRIIQSYVLDPIAYWHWKGTYTETGIEEYVKYAQTFGEVYGIDVKFNEGEEDEYTLSLPIFPALLHTLEKRRNFYKEKRGECKRGTPDWEMYEQKQKSTKVVLLACYGDLGMSSSRWLVEKQIPIDMILKITDVESDEIDFRVPNEPKEKFVAMIPHLARTALTETKDYLNSLEESTVIYGDTDSNFIQAVAILPEHKNYNNLTDEDREKLLNFGETYKTMLEDFFKRRFKEGIEMGLDKIFDKIVFGKAKKQYYGRCIYDEYGWQKDEKGEQTWYEYYKGLPLVRSDRIEFMKDYLHVTLKLLMDNPQDLEKVWIDATQEFYKGVYDHKLIIRSGLKRDIDSYVKTISPAVRAAKKLREKGIKTRPGEKVPYVVVDVKKGKPVVEPIDENKKPEEAIKEIPKINRIAHDYYWKRLVWKNIEPFLELVLDEDKINRIRLAQNGYIVLDNYM